MEKSGGSHFFNSLPMVLQTHWPSKGRFVRSILFVVIVNCS